jgi:hypothetical protein
VPAGLVDQLLVAAQEAPSSCNHQLNRYVVVTDAALRTAMWQQAGAPEAVALAPVSVVLLFRMGWNHNKLSVAQSLGMAAQNLLLAATSLGLATVIQAGIGDSNRIRSLLGIPPDFFVASIVSLGWPAGDFPRPPRLPVADVCGRNRFDQASVLAYPRRRLADFAVVSNQRCPTAEWRPERWSLPSIGAFRGLAVWHTSPRADVHRSQRFAAEMAGEVEFFRTHLGPATTTLELLPYSAAYGARLVASDPLRELPWAVFELSPHHRAFIAKRCELEGVKVPDEYHWSDDLGVDLGRRWQRVVAPATFNHLPLTAELAAFLARHVAPGGLLLVTLRNRWSFQVALSWRQRRGQVWNFGPFAPRGRGQVVGLLREAFVLRHAHGLSPTPWQLGRSCTGVLTGVCRTQCLVFEAR